MILFNTTQIFAANWQLSPELSSQIDINKLKEKFSKLDSPKTKSLLLSELARTYPFIKLELYYKKPNWVVHGALSAPISNIIIKMNTYNIEHVLESLRHKYISTIDTEGIRKSIKNEIKLALEKVGYLNAQIHLSTKFYNNSFIYNIKVDEGKPCKISHIHMPFDLPDEVILSLKTGDTCNLSIVSTKIDDLSDQLQKIGYKDLQLRISNYQYNQEKNSVDIFLEGKLGRKVVYKIIDNSKKFFLENFFSNEELPELILQTTSPESMVFEIQKFYRNAGYEDVEISEIEKIESAKNTDQYTFFVTPGKKYIISHIRIDGNTSFSDQTLLETMQIPAIWDNNNLLLNRDEINQGINAVKILYQKNGFWDVKINPPRITKDSFNSSAQVAIIIKEGKKRVYDKLEITGNKVFSNKTISSWLTLKPNEAIDKEVILAFENRIQSEYMNKGFQYIELSIKAHSEISKNHFPTKIMLSISENERVKIGKIDISGLVKTKIIVLARELLFAEGDWYNPEKISETRKILINLGIFQSVQITPSNRLALNEKLNVLDLKIIVEEGNSGNIIFGPGYNLRKGLHYLSEVSYNNLGGLGRKLSIRGSISEERGQNAISKKNDSKGQNFLGRKLSIGYLEPYILNLPIDSRVSVSHKGTAEQIWQLSNSFDLSFIYKTKYFLSDSLIIPFYNFKFNKDEGSEQQDASLVSTGNSQIGTLGIRYKWDSRNEVSWPTDGKIINVEFSWARYAFGGEFKYFKWDLGLMDFKNISTNFVWVNSISITAFEGVERKNNIGEGVLPYSERLQAGGVKKVRGFQEKLGPYVTTESGSKETTGGTRRLVLKTDFKYKLTENFALSFFIDSGNSFFSKDEINKFRKTFNSNNKGLTVEDNIGYDFHELALNPGYLYSRHYLSFGFSASYILPLGPLNIFVSFPLHEPKSTRCLNNSSQCFKRAKNENKWYFKHQVDLNIGTDF